MLFHGKIWPANDYLNKGTTGQVTCIFSLDHKKGVWGEVVSFEVDVPCYLVEVEH